MAPIVNVADLRRIAKRKLPKAVFEYVDGGAYTELTLHRNRNDLDALALNETVMRDVSSLTTTTRILDETYSMPLGIGPVGMAGLTWPNGEIAAARVAEAMNIPFCLSGFSIASIEDVAKARTAPFWSQLYMMNDPKVNESLIHRADVAGCSALVMTLDVHVHSQRWADNRNGLVSPIRPSVSGAINVIGHLPWLLHMLGSRRQTFATMATEHPEAWNVLQLADWVNTNLKASIDQDTIRWVRSLWPRKLVLKGIMTVDDAKRAVDLGADAILVSNHGGRQLDSAPSTIAVLPDIVRAVGDQVEVLFDGGIRTGFDIVKAMGRGAHACFSGRAWTYGLAAKGGPGVEKAMTLIRQELLDCMSLSGVTDLRDIPEGLVTPQPAL